MGSKHQKLAFQNSLWPQWKVNSHLVTIEIRVKCSTNQWVKLNRFSFNQFRLERLNTQSVQSWGPVKHNWVTFQYIFKNIPNYGLLFIYNFLCRFYCFYNSSFNQFTDYERFVKFGSHIFWKTALEQFQFRPHDDYRTSRIIHTLPKQVLTETPLFTF